jgi:ABC-type uncharacterized transport system substrate-binding protein
MKTRMICLAVLVVAVAFLPALLQAQMVIKTPLFRVDVPFAFMAAGVHLPAGSYIVSHVDPSLILIETQDGKARALVHVAIENPNSSTPTKLVFNKYGDQYFIAQVWTEQDQQVHHCTKCRAEMQLVAQARQAEKVVIMARR